MAIPIHRAAEITEIPDLHGDAFNGEQPNYRHEGEKRGVSYGV
jgi:hypothetical protein